MPRPRRSYPMKNCEVCSAPIEPRIYYRRDGSIHSVFVPTKYCSLACTGMAAHLRQLGKARGRFIDKSGYVILTSRRGDNGYQQPEHRAVMEAMLDRKLKPHETVHHRNGVRHDNRPDNLELWSGRHGRGHRVDDEEFDIWSGTISKYQLNALQEESK